MELSNANVLSGWSNVISLSADELPDALRVGMSHLNTKCKGSNHFDTKCKSIRECHITTKPSDNPDDVQLSEKVIEKNMHVKIGKKE